MGPTMLGSRVYLSAYVDHIAISSTSRDWSPPCPRRYNPERIQTYCTQQCLAVQAAARKGEGKGDGVILSQTRMEPWEPAILKSQPPPVLPVLPVPPLAVAPARAALLASFPTDRPPAQPAPRSWYSLATVVGSLGFGLGLRCLVRFWSWSCLS